MAATPLPPVAKCVRCSLIHNNGSDFDIVTRFFIQYAGTAPTNTQLNTFAASVGTAWGTDLKALNGTTVALDTVICEDLTTTSAAVGEAGGNVAGTRGGNVLPAATAFVTSYTISRRYRGGHPRGYWPFGVQADLATAQTWA